MIFSQKNPPPGYYVYQYLRTDGMPYYIGKGKGKRAWTKSGRVVKPPVDESRIQIVECQLNEHQAFELEIELVSKYGRLDEGTGILRNGTRGGEGSSGHIPSEERRAQQSESMNKKVQDGTFNYPGLSLKGKKQSKEQVEKRMKVHMGAKRSVTTCQNISKAAEGRVQTKEIIEKRILYVVCEYCGKEVDKGNHTRWHGDKCKHKLI